MYTGDYELNSDIFGHIASTPTSTFLPKSFEERRYEEYETSRRIYNYLREHANVFAFGDRYQANGLKLKAVQKFQATRRRIKVFKPQDFLHIVTAIFSRDDPDLAPLCEELVAMAIENRVHLASDKEFAEAVSTQPGLQRFVTPLIEALAAPMPRSEAISPCAEPDSFAPMVDSQPESPQLGAQSDASLKTQLEALRSEHKEEVKALERKHEAEIVSLQRTHEDALQDVKTGLPTPQSRRELLNHLNGLAGQIPGCRNLNCGVSPLMYILEWQPSDAGFDARCTQCATKHSL